MKIVNKSIYILLSALSTASIASSTDTYLYEKLYRLAEKIYYIEYSLSPEQRKITEELSNQIELVTSIPNDATCGSKLEVFQEAYKWAYSRDGLDETTTESEKFATLVTNTICPATYFKVYKLSYKFAYTRDGMDKTKMESKKFASKMSDYESSKFYSKNSLQCYIDNYTYAYSSGGMNKTRSEAEKFAEQQCLV